MAKVSNMDLSNFVQITLMLPAAHIFVSFIFITGYSLGFGSDIGSLFSISDIFSITLKDIYLVYLFGLVVPSLVLFDQLTGVEKNQDKPSPDQRPGFYQKFLISTVFINRLFIALFITIIMFVSFYFWIARSLNELLPYELLQVGIFALIPYLLIIPGETVAVRQQRRTLLILLFGLLLSSFASGLSRGQEERFYPPSKFSKNLSCGPNFVLRPVSERFLGILPDGTRVIMDDQCLVIFTFPEDREKNEKSPAELFSIFFSR